MKTNRSMIAVMPNLPTTAPRPATRQKLPLALALMTLTTLTCFGEGFRNPPPGTFNLGRSGGRIAHVDDSSAVHQNPANLMELKETEVQFTPTIVYMGVEFDSAAAPGQSSETEDPWKFLPNLFWAMPLENTNIAIGLGITAPFGLSVNWDNEGTSAFAPGGVLRYSAAHYNELMTMNFNPTVAFKLTDNLSLGLGLDVMWSRLTLKQYYNWAQPPWGGAGDGTLKGQGDGFGYGGNIGLTWKITERQTLAMTYRSQMSVTYEGDTTIDNIAPFAAGAGVTPRSDFSSGIDFPNMVALGYGIKITDTIRLETDVEWIQFSRFKSLVVDVHNNNLLFGGSPYVASQNWRDTFTIGIGGDWQFAERWVLRAGYQFYQSPVPDSTYSPTIPDADQNVFTIGLGYRTGHHSFQVAYGLDFYDKRTVNTIQPAFNGTYDVTVHLFSLAYALTF